MDLFLQNITTNLRSFFGFLGLFWGGLVAFLILMAWNDDERE